MGTEKKRKVQWRGGFSDRTGKSALPTMMQTKAFDNRTKTAICNLLFRIYNNEIYGIDFGSDKSENFVRALISEVYAESLASFDYNQYRENEYFRNYVESTIMSGDYDDALTLIEFFIDFISIDDSAEFYRAGYIAQYGEVPSEIANRVVNALFEQEFVGYRMINGNAVPISDEVEEKEIMETLAMELSGCKAHIQKALGFLSDRENPDYKNSIKESICAVESICQIITEDNSATLGQALKSLEDKGIVLHAALKKGFSSLYGYTSDEGGIRHAEGLFESNVTFEGAKYMLVSCCAFVNYLIAEYGKIK